MKHYLYFADRNQALIRVPAIGEVELMNRPGQRYWGRTYRDQKYWGRGRWSARSPGCGNWTDDLAIPGLYTPIRADEVGAIKRHIDTMPGGASRDRWRYWPDQADHWTVERACERAAKLAEEMAQLDMYWTFYEYRDDADELERLQAFPDGGEAIRQASRPKRPERHLAVAPSPDPAGASPSLQDICAHPGPKRPALALVKHTE